MTPNSGLRLLSGVPLDNTYSDVRLFSSASQQLSWFLSYSTSLSFGDFTYVRQNKMIRIPVVRDAILNCNYLMFQNDNYSSKYFYGFIKDIHYMSENSCDVEFEIDVFQTWMFSFKMGTCFVEREHVIDDTPGLHTIPEGFETGPYVSSGLSALIYDSMVVYLYLTEDIGLQGIGFSPTPPGMVNSMPVSCYYVGLGQLPSFNSTFLNQILTGYAEAGKIDAIISMFVIPRAWVDSSSQTVTAPARKLSGYTPVNNKLLSYPYVTLTLSSDGQVVEFDYNDLNTMEFVAYYGFGPNAQAVCFPTSYKGLNRPSEYSVSCSGFPLLAWNTPYFQNWVAQNKATLTTSAVLNATDFVGGGALAVAGSLNPLDESMEVAGLQMATNAVRSESLQLAKILDHATLPATSKGSITAGDTIAMIGKKGFYLNCMSIKPEYAKNIDNFFTRYGYKVNETKVPILKTRSNFNYIKCTTVNITGSVPVESMRKIKQAFINGITFWHNNDIGNFSLANSVSLEVNNE